MDSSAKKSLERNVKLYIWIQPLLGLLFTIPVWVAFQQRFLSYTGMALMESSSFLITMLFELDKIVGIYQRETTAEDEEILRVIYSVKNFTIKRNNPLDESIQEIKWFPINEISKGKVELQSKQIDKEIHDFQVTQFPLETIGTYKW